MKRLIINFGDLSGLVATAIEDRHDRIVLWHPMIGGETANRRKQTVAEQAVIFGIDELVEIPMDQLVIPPNPDNTHAGTQHATDQGHNSGEAADLLTNFEMGIVVLQAARWAVTHNCDTVIWPGQVNADHTKACRVCEQTVLINHLLELEFGKDIIWVDTPLVDLPDTQLVDLATKAAAPLRSAWWCLHDAPAACGGCKTCQRWKKAFDKTHIPWPWDVQRV